MFQDNEKNGKKNKGKVTNTKGSYSTGDQYADKQLTTNSDVHGLMGDPDLKGSGTGSFGSESIMYVNPDQLPPQSMIRSRGNYHGYPTIEFATEDGSVITAMQDPRGRWLQMVTPPEGNYISDRKQSLGQLYQIAGDSRSYKNKLYNRR